MFQEDTQNNPISTYSGNRHEIDNINIMHNVNSIASYPTNTCYIIIKMQGHGKRSSVEHFEEGRSSSNLGKGGV